MELPEKVIFILGPGIVLDVGPEMIMIALSALFACS
jgi:hypothetical protein